MRCRRQLGFFRRKVGGGGIDFLTDPLKTHLNDSSDHFPSCAGSFRVGVIQRLSDTEQSLRRPFQGGVLVGKNLRPVQGAFLKL